ncbi:MAG: hypothetical protein P8Y95_09905 [Gammaproteobacteria bacterium]|jgi:hypothetical protein
MDLPLFEPALAQTLRSEATEMVGAYTDTLLSVIPKGLVTGMYAKGSVYKPWDSLIDYVPDLSDVDIHVRFRSAEDARRHLGVLSQALEIAERALELFRSRVAAPTHLPRPQLVVLNHLEDQPGYLPSPKGLAQTLYGPAYHAAERADYADTRTADARQFAANLEYVRDELPEKIVDRPGAHAWRSIANLVWRVGPTGARVLTNLGMHPYDAWSLNRTNVVRELEARGRGGIAEAYAQFYLAGWRGYRSGFQDGDAARDALHAVDRLFSSSASVIASSDESLGA